MSNDWFGFLCLHLGCSNGFAQAANAQLARQFRVEVGFSLAAKGLYLIPPDENREHGGMWIDDEGIGHIRTELTGSNAYVGFEVGFAWRCDESGHAVPVDEEVPAGCELTAWWEILPVEELRAELDRERGSPIPSLPSSSFDPTEYQFVVRWEPFSLPDLFLEIETKGALPADRVEELGRVLWRAREAWNEVESVRGKGIIHDFGVSLIRPIAGNRFEVSIDFGSAEGEAIVAMLHALQESDAGPSIKCVVVRGHSMVGVDEQ